MNETEENQDFMNDNENDTNQKECTSQKGGKASAGNQVDQAGDSSRDFAENLAATMDYPVSKGDKPMKLNKKTMTRLLKAISNGCTLKSACVVAGIGEATLQEWRNTYPQVDERIELARERLREKMLEIIRINAPEDWRSAAELLKLSFSQDYRRVPQPTTVNIQGGQTVVTLSPERQAEIREQNRRIRATVGDTAPKETPRVRPTTFLVPPEEREQLPAQNGSADLPVQEAEIVEPQQAVETQAERAAREEKERSERARQIFATYEPNKNEEQGDPEDIF
jgi:hypothetical protein